tara:strand:+ start:103 stop:543 length:441 start_codon:yes stop_codon:yes gene_type:complete
MKHFEKISERLETTLANIEHQKGRLFWDDFEKLEEVLQRIKELEEANETNLQSLQRTAKDLVLLENKNKMKLTKTQKEKLNEGFTLLFRNSEDCEGDLFALWQSKQTNHFCLEMNAKIIKATKTLNPILAKLKKENVIEDLTEILE